MDSSASVKDEVTKRCENWTVGLQESSQSASWPT